MVISVQCSSCSTSFPVDTAKVPEEGVYARCSVCSGVFLVERPVHAAAGQAFGASGPAFGSADGAVATAEPAVGAEAATGAAAPAEAAPWESGSEEEFELPGGFEIVPDAADGPQDAASDLKLRDSDFADAYGGGGVTVAEEAAPETEEAEPEPLPLLEPFPPSESVAEGSAGDARAAEASVAQEASGGGADVAAESKRDASDGSPGEPSPVGTVEAPEKAAEGGPPEQREAPAAAGEQARDVTPRPAPPAAFTFGRRDPHDKARRLARVLVSDMILYNRERYGRAVANGSLREDFEDEIKKSWDEYVEQVGEELARGTPYFDEALAEFLSGGEKVVP